MFAVVERDKDITVGTVFNEPNPFVYLVFVMGICNINTEQELLSSVVNAESIGQVLNDMTYENICIRLEGISKWSEDEAAIYEWATYKPENEKKRVLTQIVSNAEYRDGLLTLRYNYSIRDEILKLNKYYTGRFDEIIKQL